METYLKFKIGLGLLRFNKIQVSRSKKVIIDGFEPLRVYADELS